MAINVNNVEYKGYQIGLKNKIQLYAMYKKIPET